MDAVTPEQFRATMACFAAGVTIVTTNDAQGEPMGLTATAFSSVSLIPPTCLVCVAHTAEAHASIALRGLFAVNFLAETQRELSMLFATTGANKFADAAWRPGSALGCPILDESLAFVECRVSHTHRVGDHDVFFGTVAGAGVRQREPLVYFRGRYARLVEL